MRSLLEDATAAALATALSTLPYAATDTSRWIAALNSLRPPETIPARPARLRTLFTLFTGSYFPALDALSAAELAGCWHVSHFLDTPEYHCFAVEETLLQRFAAGELGPLGGTTPSEASGSGSTGGDVDWAAALSTAPGELWERLERRWMGLLDIATKTFLKVDAMCPDLITRETLFFSTLPALCDFVPLHFGAAPIGPELWGIARGSTQPGHTSAVECMASALFGHPASIAAMVAAASVPAGQSPDIIAGTYHRATLAAAAFGGHVNLLRTAPAFFFSSSRRELLCGVMLHRGGQREVGAWLAKHHRSCFHKKYLARAFCIPAAHYDTVAMEWLWMLAASVWAVTGYCGTFEAYLWEMLKRAYARAALNGHISVLRWLLAKPAALRSPAMLIEGFHAAAIAGCRGALQLLRPLVSDEDVLAVASVAVRTGGLRTLENMLALLEPPFSPPASLLEDACAAGRLEVVQYLQSPAGGGPHPLSYLLPAKAARHGHTAVVRWLLQQGCEREYGGYYTLEAAMLQLPPRPQQRPVLSPRDAGPGDINDEDDNDAN